MKPITSYFKEMLKLKLIDIIAIFIAFLAVCISVYQVNTQKKLEIINKQPLLCIEFIKVDKASQKGFLLRNLGLGPALIDSCRYYNNYAEYKKKISHQEWLNKTGAPVVDKMILDSSTVFNFLENGYAIDKENKLFLIETNQKLFGTQTCNIMDSIIIEIYYKSISEFDRNQYYLKYCELFAKNNIRDSTEHVTFE